MKSNLDLSLYLVTDQLLAKGRDIVWIVEQAVAGGVTIVQLREKDCPTGEFIVIAQKLKDLLSKRNVPLIINDRLDVALAVDADGIHIGQSDMPYAIARKILGDNKIIGLSVESIDDVKIANQLDVDYIAISPVYDTLTKSDTNTAFGLKALKEAIDLSVHPTVAIGGMNKTTIADVISAGTDGVAVISAIISAEFPDRSAVELMEIITANRLSDSQ